MLKKCIVVSFFFILFFTVSNLNSNVFAKSDCCFGRDKANCSVGAQDGSGIFCNDEDFFKQNLTSYKWYEN